MSRHWVKPTIDAVSVNAECTAYAGATGAAWNCACPNCCEVRSGSVRTTARTQACVAVRGDGAGWFLVGASPDLRPQIESLPAVDAAGGVRRSPILGLLLTCATSTTSWACCYCERGRG